MSNEKRFALFVVLMFAWLLGFPYVLKFFGLAPPAPKKPPAAATAQQAGKPAGEAGAAAKAKDALAGKGASEGAAEKVATKNGGAKEPAEKANEPKGELVDPKELVLGSAVDKSPTGYRLEAQFEQKGAGVERVTSSRYDAEFEGRVNPHRPLQLIRRDPVWPPSLSLTLGNDAAPAKSEPPQAAPAGAEAAGELGIPTRTEDWLDSVLWEVVRDQGRIVLPLTREDPATRSTVEGQEVAFRTTAPGGVVVTKTFRLWQNSDGFEVDIKFESPDKDRTVAYNLMGPHGIPIEGEWFTRSFRYVFFGTVDRGAVNVVTESAYEVAKATADKPKESTTNPLRFAGVENQYFATLVETYPPPAGEADRRDRQAMAIVLHKDEKNPSAADVGVKIASKPFTVGPNVPVVHTYRVFAGPKSDEALRPYGAEALSGYRQGSIIPFASTIAQVVITPTLAITYRVTESVSRLFGSTRGNYGVAIILLTLVVKLLMFPLGRKQALMAQRTQAIQPYLKEIQEKYKDDKERQTKETLALYKKHGVNPVSGCLPALIQLPIFVGLWQALNTSVALRHSPFLWINDLAAPDMLFRFPFEVPFLGHWFNLLPFLVVGLMLFQTKLFSPPPTTPEAEMQQKMMKYMMVFMAFMFYWVPSGLGIYFITSSLWSIGERLLLPKISHAEPPKPAEPEDRGKGKPPRVKGPEGNGPAAPKKPASGLAQFWEKILEEARKDPTYRKMIEQRDGGDKDRDADAADRRERDRGKPRARPGRK
jgi:YidC/Oxa1 family membrane protein insertase